MSVFLIPRVEFHPFNDDDKLHCCNKISSNKKMQITWTCKKRTRDKFVLFLYRFFYIKIDYFKRCYIKYQAIVLFLFVYIIILSFFLFLYFIFQLSFWDNQTKATLIYYASNIIKWRLILCMCVCVCLSVSLRRTIQSWK